MSDVSSLDPLLRTLRDLADWFSETRVPGVVTGGVAASILGRPRTTRDVDGVVWLGDGSWDEFLASGEAFGFIPRIHDCLGFAIRARVFLLRHRPSNTDTDLAVGMLPFEEEAIDCRQWVDVAGVSIPLPRPEDLMIMKAVAHRARDQADIESLLDVQSGLDLQRVRYWVGEFSAALDMPEILDDLERILATHEKRKE